jgi:hypothetical protein
MKKLFIIATLMLSVLAQAECSLEQISTASFMNLEVRLGNCNRDAFYPSGQRAFDRNLNDFYYQDGSTAYNSFSKEFFYRDGQVARDSQGSWFHQNGNMAVDFFSKNWTYKDGWTVAYNSFQNEFLYDGFQPVVQKSTGRVFNRDGTLKPIYEKNPSRLTQVEYMTGKDCFSNPVHLFCHILFFEGEVDKMVILRQLINRL